MKKGLVFIVVASLLIAGFVSAFYLIFVHKIECASRDCYFGARRSCEKATYIDETPEASWLYAIKGEENGKCKINVKLLQAKKGNYETEKAAGLDMDCYVELGTTDLPHTDLRKCHGLLKEYVQDTIIKKMHTYIVDNIGQISEELTDVFAS